MPDSESAKKSHATSRYRAEFRRLRWPQGAPLSTLTKAQDKDRANQSKRQVDIHSSRFGLQLKVIMGPEHGDNYFTNHSARHRQTNVNPEVWNVKKTYISSL